MRDVVIVGDLHLAPAADRQPDAAADAAFARFGDWLTTEARRVPEGLRAILLGDTFDLPLVAPVGGGDARARWVADSVSVMDRILEAHPTFPVTIRGWLDAGIEIDLVSGNHDAALLLPGVRDRLLAAVVPAGADLAGTSLAVVPWIRYLPGVLYAEHGQQLHDLNAFPFTLKPDPDPRSRAIPLAARREAGLGMTAAALRRLVGGDRFRTARATYRREVLPAYATEIGLPATSVVAIDRLSDVTGVAIAQRLTRQALRLRAAGAIEGAGYLGPATRRIDAILRRDGVSVPVFAFGHTHRPAVTIFERDGGPAWYANPGSWALIWPRALRERLGPGRRPFVRIGRAADGTVMPRLLVWDDAAGAAVPLPG